MALGAASAAKQAGIKNAITIGIDGNPNTLAAIKKGSVTGSVYTNPKMMGKRAVQDAIKAIKGQKKANVINEIPTVVVDKSNVAKYTK
jgi:ribose transport system substrate-binding protein